MMENNRFDNYNFMVQSIIDVEYKFYETFF